ncbi:ABC transporter ATP-binding protein [Salinactinospora qingdaonensis]|uniref:ABC transporter ATP-binding protein n=1 Tax=Salinactinospora qingdaonensis TaxID=702744 RepID=A0ABP7GHE5_9ACTN
MSPGIEVHNLHLRYGKTTALRDLTFSLSGGKICGLLGRNGSGKTSLLSVLASLRPAPGGSVTIGGEAPFENPRVMPRVCFIPAAGKGASDSADSTRVRTALDLAAATRPRWDRDYAQHLLERFGLPLDKRLSSLSLGMRSALNVTIGLAARAPVTLFDESYLGMDAHARYAFYEELLDDYMATPRTIILSTHLIEEIGSLLEEVVIIDRGRLVLHEDAETLRSQGAVCTGPAEAVDDFTAGMTVLGEQRLGQTKATTVYGPLDDRERERAHAAGLELGPVALQDLFVHLTKELEGSR